MDNELCSVLVLSCDAYDDLWRPFFTILRKNWDIPFPVYLATESKTPDPAWGAAALHCPQQAWTARFREALRRIPTPYVIVLLEDFFLTGPVDNARIDTCLQHMQDDPNCTCFSFFPTTGNEPAPYEGFEKRPQTGLYRLNAQAGLWRRERLMEFLQQDENAWSWENEGNKRTFTAPDGFYSAKDEKPYVFPYDYMQHGLIGGKWFPDTPALFERYGITDVDFSARGFFDEKHRALHPQVGVNYKTAPVLYIDEGSGFCEQTAIPWQGEPLPEGAFRCVFKDVDKVSRGSFLRIDPSDSPYCMLEDAEVTVTFRNGKTWRASGANIGTNGVRVFDKIAMMNDDPQLWAAVPVHKPIARVEVRGIAYARIPENIVDRALNKAPDNAVFSRACLLNRVLRRLKK